MIDQKNTFGAILILKINNYKQEIKIIIPISNFIDKEKLIEALSILPKDNLKVTILHVIEIPSMTLPIDSSPFIKEIEKAKTKLLTIVNWLNSQGFNTVLKVVISRSAEDGIVEEANSSGCSIILMMKRRIRGKLHKILHKSRTEKVIRDTDCMVMIFLIDEKKSLHF